MDKNIKHSLTPGMKARTYFLWGAYGEKRYLNACGQLTREREIALRTHEIKGYCDTYGIIPVHAAGVGATFLLASMLTTSPVGGLLIKATGGVAMLAAIHVSLRALPAKHIWSGNGGAVMRRRQRKAAAAVFAVGLSLTATCEWGWHKVLEKEARDRHEQMSCKSRPQNHWCVRPRLKPSM